MMIRASIFPVVFAIAFASAHSAKEFQTPDGLVRITLVANAALTDSSAAQDSLPVFAPDSTDASALIPAAGCAEAVLDIYLLEKSTGQELRFPIRCPQMRDVLRDNPLGSRSQDERVVALVRDLAVNLSVHMKTADTGDEK